MWLVTLMNNSLNTLSYVKVDAKSTHKWLTYHVCQGEISISLWVSRTISAKNSACFGIFQILKTTSILFYGLSWPIARRLALRATSLLRHHFLEPCFFTGRCSSTRSTLLLLGDRLLYPFYTAEFSALHFSAPGSSVPFAHCFSIYRSRLHFSYNQPAPSLSLFCISLLCSSLFCGCSS